MEFLSEAFSREEWTRWLPFFEKALHVLLIAVLAWVLYKFVHRLLRQFRFYMSVKVTSTDEMKRIETLAQVFHYVASVVIVLVAGMLMLAEVGFSIAPILGAAGVVGVAVGFGAQSLVKDYFSGFFLLLENQVRKGDAVLVAGKEGEVEEITLRYMRLRDFEGSVHYIPNGLVTTVTNRSRDFGYAVIDVGITYKGAIEQVFELMRTISKEMKNIPEFGSKMLDDIDISGIEKMGETGITLRGRIKTPATEQWGIKREFIKRLKAAFDAHGIEFPTSNTIVYAGPHNKEGAAPALSMVAAPKPE